MDCSVQKIFKKVCGSENIARKEKSGLWSGDFEMPWDWRKKKLIKKIKMNYWQNFYKNKKLHKKIDFPSQLHFVLVKN